MKKALSFICSSLMILATYIIFSGVVGAVEPIEPTLKNVHEQLKLLAQNREYKVRPNALVHMDELCKKYSLNKKKFIEVCFVYDQELQKSLVTPSTPEKRLDFNCYAFSSYAFMRYLETGADCKYLRIFFEKKGTLPSGDPFVMGHNVVLVPQNENGATRYYICDFYYAMLKHDAERLFVPFTTYLKQINGTVDGHIEEMIVINRDDPLYFKPFKFEDARMWFRIFSKDKDIAKNIVELEKANGLMMRLRIGGKHKDMALHYANILANLYNEVDSDMAKRYAAYPQVHFWDYSNEMRLGLIPPV